ncbi:MAG: hypothetical protein WDN26_03650 [Chitinophagaceae bacterium]
MSTKKRYPYKLYVPENLDIDDILRTCPINFPGMPNSYINIRDKMLYIVHLITSIPYGINDFDYEVNLGFTPINKETLKRRVYHYKEYIKYLVARGIIIEGTNYVIGRYSKGLKFTPKYRVNVRPVTITCNSLIKSIVERNHNRDVKREDNFSYLKRWFDDELRIDFLKAKSFIDQDYFNALKNAREKRERKRHKNIASLPPLEEVVNFGNVLKMKNITIIDTHDFSHKIKFDLTSGRFHTPLTRLKKELRPYVDRGQKLVNIDITNSQPFLSLIVLDYEIFNRLDIKGLIAKYNLSYKDIEIINNKQILIKPSNTYTMLVNLIKRSQTLDDVKEYKKAVIEGKYYEKFGEILISKGLMPEEILGIANPSLRDKKIRKYAKTATFQSFFDKKSSERYNPIVMAFKSCFPNVYKIFQVIKTGERTKLTIRKKNQNTSAYNTLACVLQRFESFLVIDKTCDEINSTFPNIPIYTIHDSITTTNENVQYVRRVFEENIIKLLGVKPKFEVELW